MDKASDLDDSHLLRKIIEEKVNNTLEEPLSKLINESESHDVEEIIRKLDLKSMEDDILKKSKKSPPTSWRTNVNLNNYDYAGIIEGLNGNSTITKLKVLDKILSIQIIDTKQCYWGELSQGLRKCFVSANSEIFIRTLKIHHRLIGFPNSSCDGYLSLLKSTFLLLNSRYFTDLNKNRILQALQLIVDAQNVVFKFLLHAGRSLIDEIITAFVNVVSFKTVFDWLGLLDPKMGWLQNFCYGTYIRNVFFNCLKEKTPDFLRHIMATFVKNHLHNDEFGAHYGYFLLYFWRYENNLKFCTDEISVEHILEITISRINQKKKTESVEFITNLFIYNSNLLTQKILDLLVEPLSIVNRNNIQHLMQNNLYILTIIENTSTSKNYKVLFGVCNKLRKGRSRQPRRNSTNLLQKLVDLSVIFTKVCLNQNEKNSEGGKVLVALLHCCLSVYKCHSSTLIQANPSKLIQNLKEFYGLNWKTDPLLRNSLLNMFKFFYSNYSPTLKILGCSNEILDDLFAFTPIEDLKMIINRVGNDKIGFDFLKSNYGQIVKPYLEQIWFSDETSEENDFTKFVLLLFCVKLNTRAAVAFLSDDEESTVVESNDKTVILHELIEKSLNDINCEPMEEYLGLLTMKVMIMNLDLLLYLQANYQMQEKLKNLEEDCGDSLIIDAQSGLRHNILICLETVGFLEDTKNNFETTELAPVPQIFEMLQIDEEENELKAFLETSSTITTDFNWLLQARRSFKNTLSLFNPSLLVDLLEQVPKTYVYRKVDLQWPPPDSVYYQLYPEDFIGISLIVNYGLKSGLLNTTDDKDHYDNLALLIKQSRAFIIHQPEQFSNFDWFVGVIYLICSGDLAQCKSALINFTNTPVTSLVWATFSKEFDTTLQENFYQHLNCVLEENCTCYQALKMLGISPEALVQFWLSQCFFNYLKFEEICNFLSFSILYPAECLLYYMTSVFQHLNERICALTHLPTVETILNMTEVSNFRLSDSINFIEKLMKNYRNIYKL